MRLAFDLLNRAKHIDWKIGNFTVVTAFHNLKKLMCAALALPKALGEDDYRHLQADEVRQT